MYSHKHMLKNENKNDFNKSICLSFFQPLLFFRGMSL